MTANAWAIGPTERLPALNQFEASHGDAAQMPSPNAIRDADPYISTLRSRSRMDWALCPPPVKLAISRLERGFIPISSSPNQACSKAKMPIRP